MVTLFSDIIDIDQVCGPCGNPASPQPALFWEQSKDQGASWTQYQTLPQTDDPIVEIGDQWRFVCPDGTSNIIEIIEIDENLAQGLDSPQSRVLSDGAVFDISMYSCTDGSPIDEFQISVDDGLTWLPWTPTATANIGIECFKMRFRCDQDWSDAELEVDVEPVTNTYQDQTFNIDVGFNQWFSICFPCSGDSVWEYRVDDAYADEDHVDAPNLVTGDRPNSDPRSPTPDDAWQTIDYLTCKDCAIFSVEEVWPDAVDPDPAIQLGEYFVFYMRATCAGVSQPEIRITLQT